MNYCSDDDDEIDCDNEIRDICSYKFIVHSSVVLVKFLNLESSSPLDFASSRLHRLLEDLDELILLSLPS